MLVNIQNVVVLNNPCRFLDPFQFEISFESAVPLQEGTLHCLVMFVAHLLQIWSGGFHMSVPRKVPSMTSSWSPSPLALSCLASASSSLRCDTPSLDFVACCGAKTILAPRLTRRTSPASLRRTCLA
jgi:hypothetical protein